MLEVIHMSEMMNAMKAYDPWFAMEAQTHHHAKFQKSDLVKQVEDDFHGWHAEIEAKEKEEQLLAGQIENPDAEVEEDPSSKQVENPEHDGGEL